MENNTQNQLKIIRLALDELKGEDILELDVRKQTDISDYMVVSSGGSSRHVKAQMEAVLSALKAKGYKGNRIEKDQNYEWAVIDCGSVIVHVMQTEIRTFYDLEGLWGNVA